MGGYLVTFIHREEEVNKTMAMFDESRKEVEKARAEFIQDIMNQDITIKN